MFTSTAGSFAQRLACVYVLLWSLFVFSSHFQDQESHRMLKARLYWVQHAFTTLCFEVLKFLQRKIRWLVIQFWQTCTRHFESLSSAVSSLLLSRTTLSVPFFCSPDHQLEAGRVWDSTLLKLWVVFECFLRPLWGQQQDHGHRCLYEFVPSAPTLALSSKWPLRRGNPAYDSLCADKWGYNSIWKRQPVQHPARLFSICKHRLLRLRLPLVNHFTKRIHAKFVFIAVELILHSSRNVYKDTMSRYTKGKSESLQNVFVGEVHQHMFCVGNDEQIEDCLQFCDACPSNQKTITANKGGKANISGWWLWNPQCGST